MAVKSKDVFWFKHDYDPMTDPKLSAMKSRYGGIGTAAYWRIVEMLHSDQEHRLPLEMYIYMAIANHLVANAKQTEANAKQNVAQVWRVEVLPEHIEIFIKECIEIYKLFKSDGECFWSERVLRNIDNKNSISLKRSESGRKGGEAKANGKQMVANAKQTEANGKQNVAEERRGEENRGDKKTLTVNGFPKETTSQSTQVAEADAHDLVLRFDEVVRELRPDLSKESRNKITGKLSKVYSGKKINNIQSLVKKAIDDFEKFKDGDPIEINGKVHKSVKDGNGYAYGTIRGVEFTDDFESVILMDNSIQKLDPSSARSAKAGNLEPKDVFKTSNTKRT